MIEIRRWSMRWSAGQGRRVVLRADAVTGFEATSGCIDVQLSAAPSPQSSWSRDGARSVIREARHPQRRLNYDQAGIVTTVAHSAITTAVPRSISAGGAFAILPLRDALVIVWTRKTRGGIVALSDSGFHAELERRFGLKLGDIQVAGPRTLSARPLHGALVHMPNVSPGRRRGHVIHPIAGQASLGLRDVGRCGASSMPRARSHPGGPNVLEAISVAGVPNAAGMPRRSTGCSQPLRCAGLVRDVGSLVDRVPALQGLFIREAAGLTATCEAVARERLRLMSARNHPRRSASGNIFCSKVWVPHPRDERFLISRSNIEDRL